MRAMSVKQKKQKVRFSKAIYGLLWLIASVALILCQVSYCHDNPECNGLGLVGHLCGWILAYLFGFAGWLIPIFFAWYGWQLLVHQKVDALRIKLLCLSAVIFSSATLLAMFAQAFPEVANLFKRWIHSDFYPRKASYDPDALRRYLGGVPLHHLYTDTHINMRKLLGGIGTFLVSCTLFFVSFLLLTDFSIGELFNKLKNLFKFRAKSILAPSKAVVTARPFKAQETELSEEETLPHLMRDDPLKKITRIKIPEAKPLSPRPLQPQVAPSVGEYQLPPPSLLTEVVPADQSSLKNDLKRCAKVLEETLLSFGIEAKVGDIHCGPTITSFEVHPAVGVKVQKIKTLENDIALNMQAKSIRIIAPIPGKAAVGIEVPNPQPQEVGFRDLLETYLATHKKAHIPLLLGKMVNGDDVWADLTKMPHLIIAGATGSGKSVCINTIVMSIVMNARPDEIKLVMVDPKKVELTAYSHLPHMLAPVITESAGACAALGWLVKEMERRYEILRQLGIRNILAFNGRKPNQELETSLDLDIPEKMPYIVVIIDELADLMMVSSSDIETPIARIAQMARAVGIHMILATQRPSREVITGLIKANFPCRIAFKVSSRVNSQIIIDDNGAETLLGNGDMLFLPPGTSTLSRAQGAFIRDDDINQVIHFCCTQAPTHYLITSFDSYRPEGLEGPAADPSEKDPLYEDAKKLVLETGTASTTFIQRKMKLGYARAASLMDLLEQQGIVGPSEGAKPRKIFYPSESEEEID
jgi:DNA segregation ATPase FtsK/SpoIIIE, S-DNA-T family